jgi:hypothetical protein
MSPFKTAIRLSLALETPSVIQMARFERKRLIGHPTRDVEQSSRE